MKAFERQFGSVRVREGSALVMVIVLTVLLSLIGALFIMMSRIDEMSTSSIKADAELKAGVDAVVEKINEVLVDDVFGGGSSWLNGSSPSEAWDYPGGNDIWLGNLEPELVDVAYNGGTDIGQIGFRHITDLYGQIRKMSEAGIFDGVDSADPETDYVSAWDLRATIIDPADSIAEGYKADADGDGVADSRWVKMPDISSADGKPMYAAVRIIDNGGMININTAYRDPTDLTVPGDWDGTHLSHINLEGIMADGDKDPPPAGAGKDGRYIQYTRFGYDIVNTEPSIVFPAAFNDYITDIDYEFDVSRRILSPLRSSWNYLPFDIGDELELRNRYFLTSPVVNRFGHKATDGTNYIWQKTFDPGTGPTGVKMPYTSSANIQFWYDKATGPDDPGNVNPGICNRRHLSTTYNFERIVRPYSPMVYPASMSGITPISRTRKFGVTLPLDVQDGQASDVVNENYIRRLAMGLYRGLPNDFVLADRFNGYTREELSWQMAVNMVDYQDANSLSPVEVVTSITPSGSNTTYFGIEDLATLKRDTVCISKIGYKLQSSGPLMGTYYGIEVFNPDDDATAAPKDLSDYKIIVTDQWGAYKGEFALSDTVKNSGSSDGDDDTLVFAFNNSDKDLSITAGEINAVPFRVKLVTLLPWFGIVKTDKIIVINEATGMPVDCVTVPTLTSGTTMYRKVILPGTKFLLPATSSGVDPWEISPLTSGTRLGDDIDPASLVSPTDPNLAGLEKVQLDVPNEQLRNVGEIENVFAIGANYDMSDPNEYRFNTVISNIVESVVAIKQLSGTSELTADQEADIEMGSFGRIRLDDPDYWPMLDSLTYFDPARDGVDLVNIAEGITPTVTAGAVDVLSGPLALDSLTDGVFFPRAQVWWSNQTVYWNGTTVEIEIDFGLSPGISIEIFGAIIQADNTDEYALEYSEDGITWYPIWFTENYSWSLDGGGMYTRPDMYDDGRWQLFDTPVFASKVRVTAIDGDNNYALSEIQIGVKHDPGADDPYLYGNTVAGRVNINTAPWYVIDQLPWIEDYAPGAADYGKIAQAIVAFRDKAAITSGPDYSGATGRNAETSITGVNENDGFKNVGQLMQVINTDSALEEYDIRKYMFDEDSGGDPINTGFISGLIDYSLDSVTDDIEERNLLFHRISNLVSVRSDVFTAYILVRIGESGPQRRMIGIFDRSGIESSGDKPKLVALHRVPDPR